MTYEAWRITYQSSEQAAKAAWLAAARAQADNEKLIADLTEANRLCEQVIERAEALAYKLDEHQDVILQLTASAINRHNRCKELEGQRAKQPHPVAVRRISDNSVELTFPSCRLASDFEGIVGRGK